MFKCIKVEYLPTKLTAITLSQTGPMMNVLSSDRNKISDKKTILFIKKKMRRYIIDRGL